MQILWCLNRAWTLPVTRVVSMARQHHRQKVFPSTLGKVFVQRVVCFLRLAVLNLPADYGLPEPQPAPERDRFQLVEQPCSSMSTSVRWNSWGGVGHFAASCKRKYIGARRFGLRHPGATCPLHSTCKPTLLLLSYV